MPLEAYAHSAISTLKTNLETKQKKGRVPEDQSWSWDISSRRLSFNPTWPKTSHISFPTSADVKSWEPYSSSSTQPPTEHNHPTYSEVPRWRRKSEAQYFARIGVEMEPQYRRGEKAALKTQQLDAAADIRIDGLVIQQLNREGCQLVRLNKLPFDRMVKHYLKMWKRRDTTRRYMALLREQLVVAEKTVDDTAEWMHGREVAIDGLLMENRRLRRDAMNWRLPRSSAVVVLMVM